LHWFENARQISTLAATVKSSAGVTFIPALTGLRVPRMQADARASLTGVSMATTQEQVAYAILEGIAHSVTSCLEADQAVANLRSDELIVGGGLASSDVLLQIQADLSGIPVRRMQETDRASLRGIAYLAGSSGLLWESLPHACATAATDAVFSPRLDAECRSRRRAQWHARVESELRHAGTPNND
jgi:glycerol kinase